MPYTRRTFTLSAIGTTVPFLMQTPILASSSTPSASPETDDFGDAADRLLQMLAITPTSPTDGRLELYWSDLERHFAEFPDLTHWEASIFMPIGSLSDSPPMHDAIEPMLGFGFEQILQSVHAWQPPNNIRIMVLDADVPSLPEHWEAAGFEPLEAGFGPFWSIGEDGEVDIGDEFQSHALSHLNNIAILDDQALAFAPTSELLGGIVEASRNRPSALVTDLEPMATSIPEDAISLWCLDGTGFEMKDDDPNGPIVSEFIAESDEAVGPMPRIHAGATGITAGTATDPEVHNPDGRAYLLLQTEVSGDAEQVAEVVQWRIENLRSLATGEPYVNLFDNLEYEVVGDDLVRVIADGVGAQRLIFASMIARRDILAFAWIP